MKNMTAATFDIDGYPTNDYLWRIEKFDGSSVRLLEMVKDAWHWPERAQRIDDVYVFSTGGWSGNESLIWALQRNNQWIILCLNSIELPGGFLVVAVSDKGKEKIEKAYDWIVKYFGHES